MGVTNAIKNRIVELCRQKGLSINALANYSGLSPSSLKSILYGNSKNPTVKTIKILCDGLDITLAQFFDCDSFNDLEQEIM